MRYLDGFIETSMDSQSAVGHRDMNTHLHTHTHTHTHTHINMDALIPVLEAPPSDCTYVHTYLWSATIYGNICMCVSCREIKITYKV